MATRAKSLTRMTVMTVLQEGVYGMATGDLGSVAGGPAIEACIAHFSVMVKGTSQVFPGGPPVVKAALGYDITKEELGDERTQIRQGGVIDNLAETEDETLGMIRRFLSYLPSSVWQMPPRTESDDDRDRRDEECRSCHGTGRSHTIRTRF